MKIINIKKVDKEDVFDIEVENNNTYMDEHYVCHHNSAILYSANTALIVTKSQEKIGTEIKGFTFNLNIEKSRYVQERKKIPLKVMFDEGIYKYSGILEWALESGHIVKPKNGWYTKGDPDTGEVADKNYREKDLEPIFEEILSDDSFLTFVANKFKLSNTLITNEASTDEE